MFFSVVGNKLIERPFRSAQGKGRTVFCLCLGIIFALALTIAGVPVAHAQQTGVITNPDTFDCVRALRSVGVRVYSLGGSSPHSHPAARISCGYRGERLAIHVGLRKSPRTERSWPESASDHATVVIAPVDLPNQSFGTGDLRYLHQHVILVTYNME